MAWLLSIVFHMLFFGVKSRTQFSFVCASLCLVPVLLSFDAWSGWKWSAYWASSWYTSGTLFYSFSVALHCSFKLKLHSFCLINLNLPRLRCTVYLDSSLLLSVPNSCSRHMQVMSLTSSRKNSPHRLSCSDIHLEDSLFNTTSQIWCLVMVGFLLFFHTTLPEYDYPGDFHTHEQYIYLHSDCWHFGSHCGWGPQCRQWDTMISSYLKLNNVTVLCFVR